MVSAKPVSQPMTAIRQGAEIVCECFAPHGIVALLYANTFVRPMRQLLLHQPMMAGNIFFSPSLMTSTLKDASTNPISRVMTLMPVRPMKRAMCGAME